MCFMLPAAPGTYALVLASRSHGPIQIGRHGEMQLRPGCYVYIGSAHGPGGLRARIAHHQHAALRPRWHIDFLRARTEISSVWFRADGAKCEHEWAARVGAIRNAAVPMRRFGSSDCGCPAHLYYFGLTPPVAAFRRALGRAARGGCP